MKELLRSAEVAFETKNRLVYSFCCFSEGSNENGGLVGGFNPSEKYDRQIGSSPQVGTKIKNIWNHHPGVQIV